MGYLTIRSYDGQSADRARVEDLERKCELVGPSERVFLFTDTMGDPICRIRNSPMFKMLVAEMENQLVGVIQGSIKLVTIHQASNGRAKVGYVLGLRVAPSFRRRGIGSSLVRRLEEWFCVNDVDYAYMATEKDNEASVKLFITKLGYTNFRIPAILVNPVKRYQPYQIPSNVEIVRIKVEEAESLYRKYMSSTEFFPDDIDYVLRNKLSLGTWVAYYKSEKQARSVHAHGHIINDFESKSWAMVSVWNSGEVFKMRLGKAPLSCLLYTESSKVMDKVFPWLKLPSMPDFYEPFGFYFMYGVHREGGNEAMSGKLVRTLCHYVHNMAARESSSLSSPSSSSRRRRRRRRRDCKVIVTEIGGQDALRDHIPHWKLLSCPEDLWCIKALKKEARNDLHHLTKTPPTTRPALFVDPREV